VPKKKIWANFQSIIEVLTKKIVKKLLKIWSWDPGSEIRDPEKTYPGSRGQKAPDPGSGSATLVKCIFFNFFFNFWSLKPWIRIGSGSNEYGSETLFIGYVWKWAK
jgi:hypothetical protein